MIGLVCVRKAKQTEPTKFISHDS